MNRYVVMLAVGSMGMHAQSQPQPAVIPFADGTTVVFDYNTGGPAVFFARQLDSSYLQFSFGAYYPYSIASSMAAFMQWWSSGLKNLWAMPAGPVGVGLQSQRFNAADLDGDGTMGMAKVNYSGRLTVDIANSTATNYTPQGFALGGNGAQAIHAYFADLNGDGKPDLIASYVSNTNYGLAVMLNNGNDTFGSPVFYNGVGLHFAVLDVNHDGFLDIVTTGAYVLIGNGNGTFQAPVMYPVSGASSEAIAIADFNGDGYPDLAVGGTTGILLGNGDGTFRAGPALPAGASANSVWAFAAGDVNGDGKMDLVYADVNLAIAGVLLGNGDGTFQPGQTYALSATPDNLILADFNHDGNLDIIHANGDARGFGPSDNSCNIDILLGNGNGTFQGPLTYLPPSGTSFLSGNGDEGDFGFLAVSNFGATTPGVLTLGPNGYVNYYAGNGDGTLQAPQNVAIRGGAGPMTAADFNGDRMPDAAVVDSGAGPGGISILEATSTGFEPPTSVSSGVPFPTAIVANDFDGDGKQDLVVLGAATGGGSPTSPGTIAFLKGNGNGTFQEPVTISGGVYPFEAFAVDLNGDHLPDLVFGDIGGVYVSVNQGGGVFAAPVQVYAGRASVGVGDVNGDQIPDLVIGSFASTAGNTLSWMQGNGNGTFQPAVQIATGLYGAATYILVEDFYGIGYGQIVAAEQSGNTVFLARNRAGVFSTPTPFLATTLPSLVVSNDLNGDGKPDLLVVGTGLTTMLNNLTPNPCDVDVNGTVGVGDVLTMVSEALGAVTPANDLNDDGAVNVVDLQIDINAALNLNCSATEPSSQSKNNARSGSGRRR